jgi:hypothetical protein
MGEEPIYLVRTGKWKQGTEFDQNAHDWKHIVSRHVPTGDADNWGIQPAKHADADTTMYPSDMEPDEVVESIRITAREGTVNPTGTDPARVEYSGSELTTYGIDEMRVVRDPNTGEIITAYPLSGSKVQPYGNFD